MNGWIIRFQRPLYRNPATAGPGPVWKAGNSGMGRVRYWNGGSWTTRYDKVKVYKAQEVAEAKAFRLVTRDHSLFGEIEVVDFVPISRPKR